MASALDPPGVLPSLATAFPQTQAIAALGRLDGLQKGEWVQPEDLDADLAIAVAGLREDVPFKPLDLALSRVLLNAFKHSESPPWTLTKTWDAPLVTDTQRHLFMGLLGANPDHVPDVFLTSRTDAIEPQFPESALTFALRKNNGQQWLDCSRKPARPKPFPRRLLCPSTDGPASQKALSSKSKACSTALLTAWTRTPSGWCTRSATPAKNRLSCP